MRDEINFWQRKLVSRRAALRAAATAGGGVTALSLIGCGGDDDNEAPSSSSSPSAAPSSSSPSASSSSSSQGSGELDLTKGKPGGTLNVQTPLYPDVLDVVTRSGGQARFAGLTHSALLRFKAGIVGVDPGSLDMEPDAAQAMPEQPDETTFTFKLRPGIKFHTGKALTSEDVKYSLDRYASESIYKSAYTWLEGVQTPDAQTVVVKAKSPNADALYTLSMYQAPYILLKEHEETDAVNNKLVGSGPYVFASRESPISVTFRKNPDYFIKSVPFFDEITFYPIQDQARRVSDYVTRQVQFTFYYTAEERDQIKQSRPDAQMHVTPASGFALYLRVDQAPYTDKRVRQALSKSVDRKKMIEGVESGVGESESATAWTQSGFWGARNPKELKSAANWNYDPAAAKQLLSAAGVTGPIEMPIYLTNAGAWQVGRDTLTLAMADWKENGIANYEETLVASRVHLNEHLRGKFDGATSFFISMQILFGTRMKQLYWSPPTGAEESSLNASHLDDKKLNQLIDKNLTQFKIEDRRATVKEIDELMGEEQYRPAFVTRAAYYFTDPNIKNASVWNWSNNANASSLKYWWYE